MSPVMVSPCRAGGVKFTAGQIIQTSSSSLGEILIYVVLNKSTIEKKKRVKFTPESAKLFSQHFPIIFTQDFKQNHYTV